MAHGNHRCDEHEDLSHQKSGNHPDQESRAPSGELPVWPDHLIEGRPSSVKSVGLADGVRDTARQIYELYIAASPQPAAWQVNLPADIREEVTGGLQMRYDEATQSYQCQATFSLASGSLFKRAEEDILCLIHHDIYRRFLDQPGVFSRIQNRMAATHELVRSYTPDVVFSTAMTDPSSPRSSSQHENEDWSVK
jgi:hypothetical protein